MKTPYLFIGQKIQPATHQWLFDQGISYVEVKTETPAKLFESEVFDAFLFFGSEGINNFKALGNFPPPSSLILVNENSAARTAWSVFTNKVIILPEPDELSFVQYAVARWMKENTR